MSGPPLLSVEDLVTAFDTEQGQVRAVDGVTLSVSRGRTLGVVGESGCGKTVTALSIIRPLPYPAASILGGRVMFDGEDLLTLPVEQLADIRGNRIGMIFQEPMTALNPVMEVGAQIAEAVLVHPDGSSVSRREAWNRAVEAMREVAIPDPEKRARDYPHKLSGGMRQRVTIAMALVCRPELLIADEPTTALDVTIQAQILDLLASLRDRHNLSLMLISHDFGVIAEVAETVAVMHGGKIVEMGSVLEIFHNPQHPYTKGLLAAIPKLGSSRGRKYA
jgi:ABC-type dipeptide/oligopeptide/nickel transport system ATPase component